jgi:uncharacterized membrane protein YeaQ/YmgE (transglycosylase-associated protein family)
MIDLVVAIVIGGIVGWLAGRIMKLQTNALGYIALGMGGALVGGVIARVLGLAAYSVLGSAALSLVGAVVLIVVLRKLEVLR